MKVKLIGHTPNPEKIVASAAKLCYSPVGVEEIQKGLSDKAAADFVNMLMSLGHESPIEHVSFTFAIEGVSRVLTHQLVRHRIASYSQQSQRYVKLDQFEYIIPPAINKNLQAKEIFIDSMKEDQKSYDALVELLTKDHLDVYLNQGLTKKNAEKKALKKAIEDARFVFPNACETKIVVTMNARTLLHFFKHRCCNRAQWEIRAMATEMLKLVKKVAPTLFVVSGPPCVSGECPEGKMSCGKQKEVRKEYNELLNEV